MKVYHIELKDDSKPKHFYFGSKAAIFDQPQESLDPTDNPNDLPF